MEIPPRTDIVNCYFVTYTGPDVGVVQALGYQPDFGHHIILLATSADEDEYPDGMFFDCTSQTSVSMTQQEPIYIPGVAVSDTSAQSEMKLPDGMAVKLDSGTRLVMQAHYINTEDKPLRVQDAVNFATIPADQVETWVSAFAHTSTNLEIPVGTLYTKQVTCTFDRDVNLLYVLGHMHEWGTSIKVDYLPAGASQSEEIYNLDPWLPEYRDVPMVDEYADGEFPLKVGDSFTTYCSWFNTTDHVLGFPEEMCVTTGMIYPASVPFNCDVE
jgi:hypothetical protein